MRLPRNSPRRHRRLFVLGTLLASCTDLPTGGPTPDDISARTSTISETHDQLRPQEVLFRRIADEAPSFGGAFLDTSGSIVVWVRAEEGRSATLAALTRSWREFLPGKEVPPAVVRYGDYTFIELAAWRDSLTDQLLTIDEVVSIDLDERRNRIVVGVSDTGANLSIADEVERLRIPTTAVILVPKRPVAPLISREAYTTPPLVGAAAPASVRRNHTLQSSFNDVIGGIQIGYFDHGGEDYACTLGFVATSGSSVRLVTNSHCSDDKWTLDYTNYYQPLANLQAPIIGSESSDPGADPCGFLNLANCRYSDANVVGITSGSLGRIARPENRATYPNLVGSIDIDHANPYFDVVGPQVHSILVGTPLSKVGRTTGWTSGDVTETCVTIKQAFLTLSHHLCQHKVEAGADRGDSGSPVFYDRQDGTVFLQGILWGGEPLSGEYWMSPISGVLTDLGSMVWWSVYLPPPLTASISGPDTVSTSSFGPWDANASGGVGPYSFQWSGVLTGSGPTVWGPVSSSGWLYLQVTDSGNPPQSTNAQKLITVDGNCPPLGC